MRRKWALPVVAVGLVVGVSPADGPATAPVPVPAVPIPDPAWNTAPPDGLRWTPRPTTVVGTPQKPADDPPLPPSKPLPSPRPAQVEVPPFPAPSPRPATQKPQQPKAPLQPQPKPAQPPTPAPAPATPAPLPAVTPGPVCVTPEPGGLEPHPGLVPAEYIPVRHGTFGSPNLTLSRDYHFLDFFGIGLIGDEADAVVPGEGPATDRSFVRAEYLLWWVRAGAVPVLATSARDQMFGYLGMPGTEVLLGPGNFGSTARNGVRVRAGTLLGDNGHGIDGGVFFLGKQNTRFEISSLQFATIARPIFAPNPGIAGEFAELVAFPGLSTGSLRVDTGSYLWGADANWRGIVCHSCNKRSEWFAGYRHLNLREDLAITEFITAGPNAPDPAGDADHRAGPVRHPQHLPRRAGRLGGRPAVRAVRLRHPAVGRPRGDAPGVGHQRVPGADPPGRAAGPGSPAGCWPPVRTSGSSPATGSASSRRRRSTSASG